MTELETVAMVFGWIPPAIASLLTALHVRGIGTQAPRDAWIGTGSAQAEMRDAPVSDVS